MKTSLQEKIRIRRESARELKPELPPTPESVSAQASALESQVFGEEHRPKIVRASKRTKDSERPKMPAYLDDLDGRLLNTLSRLKFATCEQLSHFCCASRRTVQSRLSDLKKIGLVSCGLNAPVRGTTSIWAITHRGAAIMLTPMPAGGRQPSWSVMSHACHRNEVELLLRAKEDTKGFRFLDRLFLWKNKLNPAFGEHGAIDDAKTPYFVLIDDYMMQPERISRSWTRRHRPPRKFIAGTRGATWSSVARYFIVATTCELRAQKHEAWIKKHSIPAHVITFKPLWK